MEPLIAIEDPLNFSAKDTAPTFPLVVLVPFNLPTESWTIYVVIFVGIVVGHPKTLGGFILQCWKYGSGCCSPLAAYSPKEMRGEVDRLPAKA